MAQYTTSYSALASLIGTFVTDDSSEFTGNLQGIINRAEERVLRDLDTAIFNTSTQTTTSGGVQYITKPNGESPIRNIFLTSSKVHLLRRSREYVEAHDGSGTPIYYYDDQTSIYFAPVPDQAYSIKVNQMTRPQPLNSSNQTNWLTSYVADLLMWASLIESEAFLTSPERVQEYTQNYANALGPIRAVWRDLSQQTYDIEKPTPVPQKDR